MSLRKYLAAGVLAASVLIPSDIAGLDIIKSRKYVNLSGHHKYRQTEMLVNGRPVMAICTDPESREEKAEVYRVMFSHNKDGVYDVALTGPDNTCSRCHGFFESKKRI